MQLKITKWKHEKNGIEKYGIPCHKIAEYNKLDDDKIYSNQYLNSTRNCFFESLYNIQKEQKRDVNRGNNHLRTIIDIGNLFNNKESKNRDHYHYQNDMYREEYKNRSK